MSSSFYFSACGFCRTISTEQCACVATACDTEPITPPHFHQLQSPCQIGLLLATVALKEDHHWSKWASGCNYRSSKREMPRCEREGGQNDGVDHADSRACSLARPNAPGSGNGHTAGSGRAEKRLRSGRFAR